jgi:Zn-dependent protease with chaperone function
MLDMLGGLITGALVWPEATISVGAAIGVALAIVGFFGSLASLQAWVAEHRARRAQQGMRSAPPAVLLPARLPNLVDRAEPLAGATAGIRAGGRVLAFEGPPGIGKSAVATELAHRLHAGNAG